MEVLVMKDSCGVRSLVPYKEHPMNAHLSRLSISDQFYQDYLQAVHAFMDMQHQLGLMEALKDE